jgi:exodeoxyribonuclease V alpha subunit
MVWFERSDGDFTSFTPLQLPGHESAFATTVHKAQGSGFQKVVLIWPGGNPALLTREMLYTGITRAARRVEIWLPEKVVLNSLVAACGCQVERFSGLLQAF